MSGKSLEYWQSRWDAHEISDDSAIRDRFTYKLLLLLREYAGFTGTSFYTSQTFELTHNELGWFFKGRWNSHHVAQIQDAIGNYFHAAGVKYWNQKYHKVEVVFALVKKKLELNNSSLDQNGDLFRIIKTAEANTGIKFEDINYRKILQEDKKKKVYSSEELKRIEFEQEHKDIDNQILKLTSKLRSEYYSRWPYPNKALKAIKHNALMEMGDRIFNKLEPIVEVITDIKRKYPEILKGNYSTRTKDLLDSIENSMAEKQRTVSQFSH